MNDFLGLAEKEVNSVKNYQILKKLSICFNDIFSKNITNENVNALMEIKIELLSIKSKNTTFSTENEELLEAILQRLNYYLVESMHKETSGILREIINDVFKIEYKTDDYSMIDSVFTKKKDYPNIWANKTYSELNYSLKEIVKKTGEKELKETGELFTNYESQYPFDKEISMQALNRIAEGGRMKIHEGFFLWFSEFYSLYDTTLNELMKEDNVIPITWKYYLAIMAVSSIRSEYLLRDLELTFLLKGGEELWVVEGMNSSDFPEKLKKIERINNILAHQPWKLKLQDLTDIHSQYDSKGWNINELTHAVLILTYFHRLAAVVESMRFNFLDPNEFLGVSNTSNQLNTDDPKILKYVTEENVKKIIINELEMINNSENEKVQRNSMTSLRKSSEENIKMNSSFDYNIKYSNKDFNKHISSFCTVYLDFDSHSEEFFSYIEFNWQDHGSYILRNYFPKGIDAINNEVEYIATISSNNIGGDSKRLDTAQYRHTICTYVEKIFGYVNESFDYSKTNKLLNRTHKQFIKNIACFPQKITKTDVAVLKVTFSPEEIYHIILLVSAAKMRLQLTYFSKQIYEIIKNID